MPQEKTEIIPGYFYHIYNRAIDGSLLFREKENYLLFILKIKKYLLPESDILAYCLMPNHYHLLVKVRKGKFPRAMQKLALSYVVSFNRKYQRKGHLFKGRYQKKHIQQITYLLHLSRYIHINPLRADLVINPEDWLFSSYSEYIGKRKRDFVNTDIVLDVLNDDLFSTIDEQQIAYREYVEN